VESAKWVAEAGRAVVIWVPAFAVAASRLSSGSATIAVATLVGAIWFLAMRSAFGAAPFTLGPSVPAAVGSVTGLVAVSAFTLWFGLGLPASALFVLAVSVFALATAWEVVWRRLIDVKLRVLVIGSTRCASEVAEAVARTRRTPFRLVGIVGEAADEALSGSPSVRPLAELSRVVEAQRPDLIVLAEGDAPGRALDPLLDAAPGGFRVVGMTHFFEHAFGRVPLTHLSPAWFMSIMHLHQKAYSRFAKRTFDLVFASIGILAVAPLLAVIALLVRRTPGRIIYRQTRVGERGKAFTMYKFRTMREDAEEPGHPIFAVEEDPRVTPIGRPLRETHLDELPQLWNVLKGDMSIVGPRPERPEFVRALGQTVPFLTRRLLIKPGITGWAQLRCDYASDSDTAADRLSYDLWYLRHRNLVVDLAICVKTFSALVLHPGR
jgi:exopolysaccharide biosynthesis polyprenyl glycosylphosphotransferase